MKQVKCPRCKTLTDYSAENAFRPFCSERCQQMDLGAWATNKFAIPVVKSEGEDEDLVEDSEKNDSPNSDNEEPENT